MKQFIFLLLTCGMALSCTFLQQNDFISTEHIAKNEDEHFIYCAFQTGIDNYRIEFNSIVNSDTVRIFDFLINDALYTKENSFNFQFLNDTLFVLTPFQEGKTFYKSEKGTVVVLTREINAVGCGR